MRIDDRVRKIVDEELRASGLTWKSWFHPCPHGARHINVKSYGGSEFANTGMVYELCLNQRVKCMHHTKPLVPQLYIRRRFNIWIRISALDPPVNESEVLGKEALLMRENLREELEDEVEASELAHQLAAPSSTLAHLLSSPLSASSAHSSGAVTRSSSTSSAASSQRARLGRPPKPICDVLVYVYIPGRQNPLVIDAKGTPRDEVVEFVFNQPAIANALQIVPTEAHKVVYTMWHHNAQTWASYPRAHQTIFLAPGERVLYRDMYLATTPNLEHYKALLLPPSGQPDNRPRIPSIAPPYASRRVQQKASADHLEPQSMPGTPNLRSLLDLLPFAFDDDEKTFEARLRSHVSKVRKRSESPIARAASIKRQRKSRSTAATTEASQPTLVSASGPSDLNMGAGSRRDRKGKGKGRATALDSDVIVLSD